MDKNYREIGLFPFEGVTVRDAIDAAIRDKRANKW